MVQTRTEYVYVELPAMPENLKRERATAESKLRVGQLPGSALKMCLAEDKIKAAQHRNLLDWFQDVAKARPASLR